MTELGAYKPLARRNDWKEFAEDYAQWIHDMTDEEFEWPNGSPLGDMDFATVADDYLLAMRYLGLR